MQTRIRQATTDDYDALCAILNEADALHSRALPHIFRAPNGPARSRDYIASIIEDAHSALWVAERAQQLVGVLLASIRDARDTPILVPRRSAVVTDIAVLEAHRRTGIGQALMRAAEEWAILQGADEIQLHVWEFNQGARRFYDALGFCTASRMMSKPVREASPPSGLDSQ
jgi:ribosomal protein S18 acetylase RimI-like enzyme